MKEDPDLVHDPLSSELLSFLVGNIKSAKLHESSFKFYSVDPDNSTISETLIPQTSDIAFCSFDLNCERVSLVRNDLSVYTREICSPKSSPDDFTGVCEVFAVRVTTSQLRIWGCADWLNPIWPRVELFCVGHEHENWEFKPWNIFIFCYPSNNFPRVFFNHFVAGINNERCSSTSVFQVSPVDLKSILNN